MRWNFKILVTKCGLVYISQIQMLLYTNYIEFLANCRRFNSLILRVQFFMPLFLVTGCTAETLIHTEVIDGEFLILPEIKWKSYFV